MAVLQMHEYIDDWTIFSGLVMKVFHRLSTKYFYISSSGKTWASVDFDLTM